MIALVGLGSGCSRPDPETALRQTIATMQDSARDRSASGVLSAVDADFAGPGGLDRDGLNRLLRLQFLRNQSVGVRLGPLDVAMFDDRARVEFTAVLTGGSGRFLPDSGRVYNVETNWRRESNGDWLLMTAHWRD